VQGQSFLRAGAPSGTNVCRTLFTDFVGGLVADDPFLCVNNNFPKFDRVWRWCATQRRAQHEIFVNQGLQET
jgi:hypothetical protein